MMQKDHPSVSSLGRVVPHTNSLDHPEETRIKLSKEHLEQWFSTFSLKEDKSRLVTLLESLTKATRFIL